MTRFLRVWLGVLEVLWALGLVLPVEGRGVPDSPSDYVTDTVGILAPETVASLNAQLAVFVQETSTQMVVWIEAEIPADTTLESYLRGRSGGGGASGRW